MESSLFTKELGIRSLPHSLRRQCRLFSSGGGIEARVLALRDEYQDDQDKVIGLVLSHIKVASKAKMVLALLEYLKTSALSLTSEGRLRDVLRGLASLESK